MPQSNAELVRSGSLSDLGVHLWTVQDGKATHFHAFAGDQHASDEFWS